MATNNHSGTTIVQQHALTPNDYLTITPQGIFLNGQPAEYYKIPLYKSFCVCESMIKRLVKRFPNVNAVHCMLSQKTPQYIEHPYSYGYDKYSVLQFSVDDPVTTFGFNKWFRMQLIGGINTPWYCTSPGIKKSLEDQALSDEIWEDMFQNGMKSEPGYGAIMGRFIGAENSVRLLPGEVLACALCDQNILNMLEYLNCDPILIPERVAEGWQLVQQKQSELLHSIHTETKVPGQTEKHAPVQPEQSGLLQRFFGRRK